MEEILSRLKNGSVIVADGAMGTMLQAAGLPPGAPPPPKAGCWRTPIPCVMCTAPTSRPGLT